MADSLRGGLMAYADPAYLDRLLRGIRIVQACIVLGAAAIAATVILRIATNPITDSLESGLALIRSGIAAAAAYGYILFSWPEPGVLRGQSDDGARRALRVGTAAQTILAPTPLLPFLGTSIALVELAFVLTLAWCIAWPVQYFLAVRYLREIAPRLPDRQLFRRAEYCQWLLPILIIPGFFTGVAPLVSAGMYFWLLGSAHKSLALSRDLWPVARTRERGPRC